MFLQNYFTGIKDKFAESGKNIEAGRIWDKPNSRKENKVGRWGGLTHGLGPVCGEEEAKAGQAPLGWLDRQGGGRGRSQRERWLRAFAVRSLLDRDKAAATAGT